MHAVRGAGQTLSNEAIFGVLIACITAIAGLWLRHILDCRDRDRQRAAEHSAVLETLATIKSEVLEMRGELGTHETGMIGQMHRFSKIITRLCERAGIES